MSLKEELADIDAKIEKLKAKKREIYKASLDAPEEEKVCGDFWAESLSEPSPFPRMKFPIEVTGINWVERDKRYRECQLVAVRPAGKKKTYLGIYVGDLPLGAMVSYHTDSGVLSIDESHHNPAIVVPDLGRVVMGCESWWGRIKNNEEFKDITDKDIDSVWYVKMLKALTGETDKKEKTQEEE